jgi:hypothetical protein
MNCPLKGQINYSSLRRSSVDLSDGHLGSLLEMSFKTTLLKSAEGNH